MNGECLENCIKRYGKDKLLEGKLLAFNDILRFLLRLGLPDKTRKEILLFIENEVKEIEKEKNENE